jgi:hypothetical protein
MQMINLGSKQQAVSLKHPMRKEASIYSNSNVNNSILDNS